jgi:hypothetical protein
MEEAATSRVSASLGPPSFTPRAFAAAKAALSGGESRALLSERREQVPDEKGLRLSLQ